jgi:membrane protein involved in colicin uptake
VIALSKLAGKVPSWLYATALICVLAGAGMLYQRAQGNAQGRAAVQALWDADKKTRAAAETKAVAQRAAENLAQARQQAATALAITKAYDDEINDVRARLAAAERMRKPAFCASAGSAASAGASGPEGGAAGDSAGGLLPDAVARDIQALILQTEEVAATGRACQSFVRGNGMTP